MCFISLLTLTQQFNITGESHITLSTSLLLAVVAYQLVVNSIIPELPFLTILDFYIYFLFGSAAFTVVYNIFFHIHEL